LRESDYRKRFDSSWFRILGPSAFIGDPWNEKLTSENWAIKTRYILYVRCSLRHCWSPYHVLPWLSIFGDETKKK